MNTYTPLRRLQSLQRNYDLLARKGIATASTATVIYAHNATEIVNLSLGFLTADKVSHNAIVGIAYQAGTGKWCGECLGYNFLGDTITNYALLPTANESDMVSQIMAEVEKANQYKLRLDTELDFAIQEARKNYDPHTSNSDDHSVWAGGERVRKHIQQLETQTP